MPMYEWVDHLCLILVLGRALKTGEMKWDGMDNSFTIGGIIDQIQRLMKGLI